MKNFFQHKYPRFYSFIMVTTPFLVLAIASIIPILKTYGRLNIGYDTFIPLIPENSFNMTYELLDSANGNYISNSYIFWVWIVYTLRQLVSNIYQAAFLYQFLIFFLSGYGIYHLYNLFNNNKFFGLIPAIFFIYSPHLFDHMLYYQGTVAIVWITYFFMKFIKNKTFTIPDILYVSVLLGVIVDLPNPKYHFLLLVLFILTVLLGLLIKLLHFLDIIRNLKYFILILLCTAYISVPLIHFGYSFFQTSEITINTRAGYEEYGQTLDYGAANVYKMISLFHITDFLGPNYEKIPASLILFVYYAIPFIIFGLSMFILPKLELKKRKIAILYLILGLFFIFFSKSSNPPFGFVYEWILSSSQFFAFMRTTAGLVIYAAVFYSLIFGIVFQYLAESLKIKKLVLVIACFIILIAGFPIWSGAYFKTSSSTNGPTHGLRLPSDYFNAGAFVRELQLDGKIDIYPYAQGYQGNKWGPWNYYGFIIYPWIFDKPVIAFNKTTPSGKINSFTNTRYFVHDKSIGLDNRRDFGLNKKGSRIFSSKTVDIFRKTDKQTIPHFYTPTIIRIADNVEASIKKRGLSTDVAFYNSKDLDTSEELKSVIFTQPSIEYKKINPTKYLVRIHKAVGKFQLLFSENFHRDWIIYAGKNFAIPQQTIQEYWQKNKTKYIVNIENEYDQSSIEEVGNLISTGVVSHLGSRDEMPIKFISKQFLNTIQNDNLPSIYFYETFWKSPIQDGINHYKVNTFANSWIIDTQSLCKNTDMKCIRNPDGSYDFELLIEFWPQKLKNMMYVVSISTGVVLLGLFFIRKDDQ